MQKVKNYTNKKIISILKKIPLLEGFSEDALRSFSKIGLLRSFNDGEVIFKQNDPASEFFIILEGSVEIALEAMSEDLVEKSMITPKVITKLGEGNVFGEFALELENIRTATAISNGAILFVCTRKKLFDFCDDHPRIGLNFFHNLNKKIFSIVSSNNKIIIAQYRNSHVAATFRFLFTKSGSEKNLINPTVKEIDIEEKSTFLLAHSPQFEKETVDKERLKITLSAEPAVLAELVKDDEPNLGKIIASLLKSIRFQLPITGTSISGKVSEINDKRQGTLSIKKKNNSNPFYIEWHVKGALFERETQTVTGNIQILVYQKNMTRSDAMENYFAYIKMPVQDKVLSLLNMHKKIKDIGIIVLHHHTSEVVNTLVSLKKCGFSIEGYMGIPYGNIDPRLAGLLDYVSTNQYHTVHGNNYAHKKTEYTFDFYSSSHMSLQAEKEIRELFEGLHDKSYLNAMNALAGYMLTKTIRKSIVTKKPFIILEDGGYFVPIIYEAYYRSEHPFHELVKIAIERKLLLGVVEGTASGEVRDLNCLKQFSEEEQTLIPVLSGARDRLKTAFESKGIAASIIQTSELSLRNLALHGLESRRILVIGGNGAIGTRLIEQLMMFQRVITHLYLTDLAKTAFKYQIDNKFSTIKTHSDNYPVHRFSVLQNDIILPHLDESVLGKLGKKARTVVTNHLNLSESHLSKALKKHGYRISDVWKSEQSIHFVLEKNKEESQLVCVSPFSVLSVERPLDAIHQGVNTVFGVTGFSVFDEACLDAFLFRSSPTSTSTDDLVLISGSSKDTEFKKALQFLNELMMLNQFTSDENIHASLNYFQKLHSSGLQLFAHKAFDQIFSEIDFDIIDSDSKRNLYANLKERLSQMISIRKEITVDVGSIYYIEVNGTKKRLILLADGLVINFFAPYSRGASLDYIDPILTLQLLGVVHLAKRTTQGGFQPVSNELHPSYIEALWSALDNQLK